MKQVYNLDCIYDSAKSFYNKARVEIDGVEEKLYSYNTLVGKMTNNALDFIETGWSRTTNRHIREWLRQHDMDPKEYM